MSETTSIIPAPILALIDAGNGLLWGSVLIYLLIGAGLFFTVMTKGQMYCY